jgi:hypothetical protein
MILLRSLDWIRRFQTYLRKYVFPSGQKLPTLSLEEVHAVVGKYPYMSIQVARHLEEHIQKIIAFEFSRLVFITAFRRATLPLLWGHEVAK